MASLDGDNRDGAVARTPDDKIVQEAKRRFKRCAEWESNARKLFLEDLKFCNADSDNGYQWPNEIRRNRDVDERPCLTINKTRQHCLTIINDAKQNKPSVSVKPVGDGASFEAAQVFEGIVRHIEYISNAQAAYDTATSFQVEAGIGYWRVVTDYDGADDFDQEIFIRRIRDPLTVYLDPDIHEIDGSDARFGFIFDDMSKEAFAAAYPGFKDKIGRAPLGNDDGWIDDDHVRVAEYYRKTERADRLIAMIDPTTGEQRFVRASKLPAEILDLVLDDPQTKQRDVIDTEVEWFLIVGDAIAERNVWPGRYVPIVRVIGEEVIINGELDRKGHTRALKDPQRIYNYWNSSAVEFVALQDKSPYVAPVKAVENLETYWSSANRINHAFLPYNHLDDAGNPIPPPQRSQPPVMAAAYVQGMQVASDDLRAVSGQFQSQMGEPSNERSGIAIQQRQRQGDNATYHFIDNLALAIRFTGKILIDLIPKIYDTSRVIRILAEDGTEQEVTLDPQARLAYLERAQQQGAAVRGIFNPTIGKYDVEADIGPAFATRRQEAFNAFLQIAGQSPEIMRVAGDLMFRAADFPMADELAERLKRMVPAQALGEGPSPQEQGLQQQVQQLQGLLTTMTQALAEEKAKLKTKDQQKDIDVYNAETDRLRALGAGLDPEQLAQMTAQLVLQAIHTPLAPVVAASAGALAQDAVGQEAVSASDLQPPIAGARRARDGHWYLPDPTRPGKYLMVAA